MKKVMVMLAAVCIASAGMADSTGATTNWVARYVAQAISNSVANISATTRTTVSNGTTTVVIGGTTEHPVTMRCEANSVAALAAFDCTADGNAKGVTNGVLWAWDDAISRYRNRDRADIVPSATNFMWNAFHTELRNGKTTFVDGDGDALFSVAGIMIQPRKARIVKGE